MKQFFITIMIVNSVCATSLAAEKEQQPLAQKLADQNMTQGLTTETPSGVPGLNYSGGVAGYAGPSRPSDKAEPMPQKPTLPLNPADIANQQEEIFRKVIEEVTGDQPKAVQELRTQSQQKVPRKNQTTPQAQQQLQTPRR